MKLIHYVLVIALCIKPYAGLKPPLTSSIVELLECSQDEPMDTDQSSTFLSSIQSEIAKYQLLIEEENQKLKRYKVSLYPMAHSNSYMLPFM